MSKSQASDNSICRNRKAGYRFEILEKYECGVVLLGTEVKSLRERNASLDEAFARLDRDELWLLGFHIAPYSFGHTTNHEPMRRRKLLLHSGRFARLSRKWSNAG